jgi:polyhydroxyalkanoate synthase
VEFSNNNEVMKYLEQHANQFNHLVKDALTRHLGGTPEEFPPIFNTETMLDNLSKGANVDSNKLLKDHMNFMEQHMALWQSATKTMAGEKTEPVIQEERGDRRFKDKEWQENPVYNYLKQSYLLNAKMLQNLVDSFEFEDSRTAERIRFYTRQYINSVSPTNYVLTNPEVCRQIIETEGQNLAKGMENYIRDLEKSPMEAFRITQTDENAFTLGENLANTPGKVIFRNDLIELIQYTPTTEQVNKTPLLIVPPFINKYYILDLNEQQSLVRWLVSQGQTVFIISWVNPDESLAEKTFDDYIVDGTIKSLDVIQAITGEDKINVTGYCVGGTLLAITQGYLKGIDDQRINSLTFFTTLLDFAEAGEITIYLGDDTVPLLKENARNKGVFDGRILSLSFSMLRENNLFWSYFINNYLKGQDPAPFDILYWNSDPTNMTPETFCDYVQACYLDNRIAKPGGVQVNDVPVDLKQIDTPTYFLATISDHIVPWQSAYLGTQILQGPKRFVLAGSGHIAGVINSVESGKYPHWINDSEPLPETAEQWFEGAIEHAGSWWPDWLNWLNTQSTAEQIDALQPGQHPDYPAIEEAPGSYVRVRL